LLYFDAGQLHLELISDPFISSIFCFFQDGPLYPDCRPDDSFNPRQCNGFTKVCWCVNTQTGVEIEGTITGHGEGFSLDCSGAYLIFK